MEDENKGKEISTGSQTIQSTTARNEGRKDSKSTPKRTKRVQQEKDLKEREQQRRVQQRKERVTREQKRKEKLEKAKKLQEHYDLFRLTTEYIDENTPKWDAERKKREQERQELIENWEKKSRFEKIKELKRRRLEATEKNENTEDENADCIAAMAEYENKWQVWRKTTKKKEHEKAEIEMKATEPVEPPKLFPIFHRTSAKISKPRIITTLGNEATEFAVKDDTHCISALMKYENTKIHDENTGVQVRPTDTEVLEVSNCKETPEIVAVEYSTVDQNTGNLEPLLKHEDTRKENTRVQVQPADTEDPAVNNCKIPPEIVVEEYSTVDQEPEIVVEEYSAVDQKTRNLEPLTEYEESIGVRQQPTRTEGPEVSNCNKPPEIVIIDYSTVEKNTENLESDNIMKVETPEIRTTTENLSTVTAKVQCKNSNNENPEARKQKEVRCSKNTTIAQYFNTTSTNTTKKNTTKMKIKAKSAKNTTKIKEEKQNQELDKMQKFWSKYKIPENKNLTEYKNPGIADESLPTLTKDGSSSKNSNQSESHASLPDRRQLKSESNLLATTSNPEWD